MKSNALAKSLLIFVVSSGRSGGAAGVDAADGEELGGQACRQGGATGWAQPIDEIGECIKEWGGAGGAGPRRQGGAAGAGAAAPPEELDERIKEWVARGFRTTGFVCYLPMPDHHGWGAPGADPGRKIWGGGLTTKN